MQLLRANQHVHAARGLLLETRLDALHWLLMPAICLLQPFRIEDLQRVIKNPRRVPRTQPPDIISECLAGVAA